MIEAIHELAEKLRETDKKIAAFGTCCWSPFEEGAWSREVRKRYAVQVNGEEIILASSQLSRLREQGYALEAREVTEEYWEALRSSAGSKQKAGEKRELPALLEHAKFE